MTMAMTRSPCFTVSGAASGCLPGVDELGSGGAGGEGEHQEGGAGPGGERRGHGCSLLFGAQRCPASPPDASVAWWALGGIDPSANGRDGARRFRCRAVACRRRRALRPNHECARPLQPTRRRVLAVPPAARGQPGGLVRLGGRGAAAGAGRAAAHPPLHRLLGLPLVPRDGPRVLRGPGHRGADERALREREGGPGGAARPGPDLPGRRAADGRAGRLAADRVPHAGAGAVLRRHLLPARASARPAVVQDAARGAVPRVERGAGQGPGAGRRVQERAPPARDLRARDAGDAGLGRRRGGGGAGAGPGAGPGRGRLRGRAEVPEHDGPGGPAPGVAADRQRGAARGCAPHPGPDGDRRHPRPARRRLPPLQRRPPLAGAALREDALRQRASPPPARRGAAESPRGRNGWRARRGWWSGSAGR